MDTIISNSPEETEAIAACYAHQIVPGTVIGLSGDMGAGKTCWMRGFCKGLGITSRVHSPTFALMNEYDGAPFPVVHIDLYRLESVAAILDAGLEHYLLTPKGITVVEWIERWPHFAPPPPTVYRSIFVENLSELERKIHFSGKNYK